MQKVREGSSMNPHRRHHIPALAVVAGSALLAIAAASGAASQAPWPTLTTPSTPQRAPDADGFLPRWLLLEPIGVNGLTDSAVQAIVKKEYFPDQFTVIPHDGDKVTVGDAQLTWPAVAAKNYNVNAGCSWSLSASTGSPTALSKRSSKRSISPTNSPSFRTM